MKKNELSKINESILLNTWDELSDFIGQQKPLLEEIKTQYMRCSMAVGAAILIFSQHDEVQKELAEMNAGKRGRAWTAEGLVAKKLADQYGDKLPSANWMNSCARAASEAKAKGLKGGSVHQLLGWKESTAIDSSFVRDIDPARNLDFSSLEKNGTTPTPEKPPFDLTETLKSEAKKFHLKLIDALKQASENGQRPGVKHSKALIDELNSTLEFYGACLGELPSESKMHWAEIQKELVK